MCWPGEAEEERSGGLSLHTKGHSGLYESFPHVEIMARLANYFLILRNNVFKPIRMCSYQITLATIWCSK